MVPPAGFEPTADPGSRPGALPTELWGLMIILNSGNWA